MFFSGNDDPIYTHFVRQVVQKGLVYTLSMLDENELAECPSEYYDNQDGEPAQVYCFWSSEEAATQCRHDEWANYEVEIVPLETFIQHWLVSMHEATALVGVEFDEQLFGSEVEPAELLGDILGELKQQNKWQAQYEHLLRLYLDWERNMAGQNHLN